MARPRVNPVYGARLGDGWRGNNIGRLLFTAAQLFERDIFQTLHSLGFPEVRMADLVLFRSLDLDGTRLTELAARSSMTKPGMKELVDQAEAQGFVSRVPDRDDRRAKVVKFTARGRQMLEALHQGVDLAQARLVGALGADVAELLTDALYDYLSARGVASGEPAEERPGLAEPA